jgi:hypothetical protein
LVWEGGDLAQRRRGGVRADRPVTRPARIGALAFDLHAGPTGRFDFGNGAWVDLGSGALASVPDQALFAGANALAAELTALGRYRLTRLLRGQLGTEDAIGNPAPAGARAVILDAAVSPVSISEADVGMPWNWRIGPARAAAGDPVNAALAFIPEGLGLRPFSPSHLRGAWQLDGSVLLTWIRRTRAAAGDSWVLAEAPLGEAREEYELEVLDGAAVVRTAIGLAGPAFTYTAAMAAADFGGPVTTLSFRVFQVGALGRGAPAEATVDT